MIFKEMKLNRTDFQVEASGRIRSDMAAYRCYLALTPLGVL